MLDVMKSGRAPNRACGGEPDCTLPIGVVTQTDENFQSNPNLERLWMAIIASNLDQK